MKIETIRYATKKRLRKWMPGNKPVSKGKDSKKFILHFLLKTF